MSYAMLRTTPYGSTRRNETDLLAALLMEDPDGRAQSLESLVKRASRSLDSRRRIWAECDGMVYHDQWGRLDDVNGSWQPRGPAPSNRVVRIENNVLYPMLERRTSLLTSEKLNLGVRAATSEGKDAAAAKGGDKILRYAWEHLDMEGHRQEIIESCGVLGNWYLHPMWDDTAGPLVTEERAHVDPETGEPLGISVEEYPVGDVVMESLSPYEVIADTAATNREPGMWIAAHRMVPLQILRNSPKFDPGMLEGLVPDGLGRDGAEYVARRQSLHPRSDDPWGSLQDSLLDRESVLVTTLYVRRTGQFPRGRMFIIAGGKELYAGDNPMYPQQGEPNKAIPEWPYPIFPFRDHVVPGSFHGQGCVVRGIGPQKTINGAISKAVLQIRKASHPTLIKPKGIDFTKSDEPDQQVSVNPQLPPGSIYYLQSPQFPQETFQLIEHELSMLELIFGVNEATQGALPSADTSGRAIEALQQQNFGRLGPVQMRHTRQFANVMTYVLRLYQRHCEIGRQVEISGEDRRTEVVVFNEATMSTGLDVIVFDDLMRPRDPARRLVWAQTLAQIGLYRPDDPRHRAALAQLVGFGDIEGFEETTLRGDYDKQERENLRLLAGEPVEVNFWEDDQEHLASMTNEMNSEGWRTATTPLPTDPPQVQQQKLLAQQIWMQHYQAHLQQQATKQQQAMAAQMPQMPAPQGAPGPGAPMPAPTAGGPPAGVPA